MPLPNSIFETNLAWCFLNDEIIGGISNIP